MDLDTPCRFWRTTSSFTEFRPCLQVGRRGGRRAEEGVGGGSGRRGLAAAGRSNARGAQWLKQRSSCPALTWTHRSSCRWRPPPRCARSGGHCTRAGRRAGQQRSAGAHPALASAGNWCVAPQLLAPGAARELQAGWPRRVECQRHVHHPLLPAPLLPGSGPALIGRPCLLLSPLRRIVASPILPSTQPHSAAAPRASPRPPPQGLRAPGPPSRSWLAAEVKRGRCEGQLRPGCGPAPPQVARCPRLRLSGRIRPPPAPQVSSRPPAPLTGAAGP